MRFDLQRPACDAAIASLWEYLDAELPPDAARIVGVHLDGCLRCGPRVSAALALKRIVRASATGVRAPASVRERVAAR